ncbi:MAG: energy transducer TonB [Muribaculaceae bacterium]|nr:energy transducer TonB [Muribaculaceae bacterium]
MKQGKHICNTLKQIRLDIARANDIEYTPTPCNHEGDCMGTCPACENEVRFLEREIARKLAIGKAAIIAGVSLGISGLSAMAGNSASNSPINDLGNNVMMSDSTQRDEIYGLVGQMPLFPGSETELMKFLSDNIVYPAEAVKNKIQGKVVVQIYIDKTGKVGEVKVVRGVHEDLDREAVRVCKLLPDFTPAKQNGEAYGTWYTLPIIFKLTDDTQQETK